MSQLSLQTRYCLDTSVIIDLVRRRYDDEVFPDLRVGIEDLVAEGRMVAPEEVRHELRENYAKAKSDDPVLRWVEERPRMFVPLDEQQAQVVREILKDHPKASGYLNRTKPAHADVFLIALAESLDLTVVSEERSRPGSDQIPDICLERGIRCLTFLGLLKDLGWVFVRR